MSCSSDSPSAGRDITECELLCLLSLSRRSLTAMSITSFLYQLGFLGRSYLGLWFGDCAPAKWVPDRGIMQMSEPHSTDKEPATLDQDEQSGGAARLAVLAQLLLETQRVNLRVYLLVVLPDQVRVKLYVVVHLFLFLLAVPSSRTMARHRRRRIGQNAH